MARASGWRQRCWNGADGNFALDKTIWDNAESWCWTRYDGRVSCVRGRSLTPPFIPSRLEFGRRRRCVKARPMG